MITLDGVKNGCNNNKVNDESDSSVDDDESILDDESEGCFSESEGDGLGETETNKNMFSNRKCVDKNMERNLSSQ